MFIKKAVILLIPIIMLTAVAYFCAMPVKTSATDNLTVVIDAGHGGIDGGVVGANTGVKESELNLEIAKTLKSLFESAGIKAVMTRNTSAGLYGTMSKGFKLRDLKERVNIAETSGAQIFISIHMNKYSDSSRRGAQVFFKIGDDKSKNLAESIQSCFNDMENAPRSSNALGGDYYVLNNVDCAAVICECGFLSNPEDERLLLDKHYQGALCQAILYGTIDHLVKSDGGYENFRQATEMGQ